MSDIFKVNTGSYGHGGFELLPILTPEEHDTVKRGDKLAALTAYRERTNTSWGQARCAVEQFSEHVLSPISPEHAEFWDQMFMKVGVELSHELSLTPAEVATRARQVATHMLSELQNREEEVEGMTALKAMNK